MRSNNEGLPLSGIQARRVRWRLGEEVGKQFRDLVRVEIGVVKGRVLAQGEDGVLEV